MQTKPTKTVGIILAGGAGSRLGGVDKGLQLYQGTRLIEHTIGRLRPQVDDLVICANRNLSEYQALGFSVVRDSEACSEEPTIKFEGPMAGVSAALSHLKKSDFNSVVVASCDVPNLPSDLVEKLISGGDQLVAVAHDGERRQNLHCLIREPAWQSLRKSYASGERAMHQWFKTIGFNEVDFSAQAKCFYNINSAELLDS